MDLEQKSTKIFVLQSWTGPQAKQKTCVYDKKENSEWCTDVSNQPSSFLIWQAECGFTLKERNVNVVKWIAVQRRTWGEWIQRSWLGRQVFWEFKTPRKSVLPLFPFHLCMCLCIHICIYICMYLHVCLYFTWEMSRARNQFCWIFIIILLLKVTLMQNTCSLGEMLNSPNWMCFDLKQWVWALL